ncbi:MAG: hypothetical protein PVJ57_14375 [Phycisphaerae bacterium]|jgi:hypothetical protein
MSEEAPAKEARSSTRFLVIGLIGVLLAGGLNVFADYAAVAPWGSISFLAVGPASVLIGLFCIGTIPIAAVCCLSRRLRERACQVIMISVFFVIVLFVALRIGGKVRMSGFRALAQRSALLVQAIKSYEQAHGSPPPNLEALVPEFLPAVPGTGMGAYPQYQYCASKERTRAGNPWRLVVPCSIGFANTDEFVYLPKQNYGPRIGGWYEQVEDWGYFHE